MAKIGKIILFTGIGTGLAYLAVRLLTAIELKNAGNKLGTDLSYKIHKFTLTDGLEIWVDVVVKNPTQTTIKITQPYVELLSNDSVLASTAASGSSFDLLPGTNVKLETTKLNIKILDLALFLIKINYKFPTTADTLLKKAAYLLDQGTTQILKMGLAIRYSTYANNFEYISTTKLTA